MTKKYIIIGIIIFLMVSVGIFYFINQKKEVPIVKNIEIYNIISGQAISSPLTIKGRVMGGHWTGFEGQVGIVELVDSDGERLGLAILNATSDWMKMPTNFEATLSFEAPKDSNVFLIFHNENPSGMPDREEVMSLPVKFLEETSIVKVYFSKQGNEGDCTAVFPVERNIIKTEAVARVAIEELIKGPTDEEKNSGYFSGINQNSKINKLTIVNGTAMIDFNEALEEGIGGSCLVAEIRKQITETLMQFSSVKKVVISIDGRTEDILQP
ncbi:MAG: GerMN domain-containing protein [Candidatus Paceibacterota bacterium]|jgi:hypothetical protein